MRELMRTELPLVALMMAFNGNDRPKASPCHSDLGSHHASDAYGTHLIATKVKSSMSRTACGDRNGPVKSLLHGTKVEVVHPRRWAMREDARCEPFVYIESYYERQRIHSAPRYKILEHSQRNVRNN